MSKKFKPPKEKLGHVWRKWRAIPWEVCRRCGLVALRNEATERRIRAGCDADND